MQALYVTSVFLHVLAAVVWLGGMFFLMLVVVPWLRAGNRAQAGAFLRDTGIRFRGVGWACLLTLLGTGTLNLWFRRVGVSHFADPEWLASPFGRAVALKVLLFGLVLTISVAHDFRVGPAATRAMREDPAGPEAVRLRRAASWMGRANTLLAVALVFLGVVLVRGWP